jgi:hypothetical protein
VSHHHGSVEVVTWDEVVGEVLRKRESEQFPTEGKGEKRTRLQSTSETLQYSTDHDLCSSAAPASKTARRTSIAAVRLSRGTKAKSSRRFEWTTKRLAKAQRRW